MWVRVLRVLRVATEGEDEGEGTEGEGEGWRRGVRAGGEG